VDFKSVLPPELQESRPVGVLDVSLQRGRLSHAILLHGERLDVLDEVAQALTKVLLDSTRNPFLHPDLFTLRPAKKARQIRIGERSGEEPNTMRKLLRDLSQSSNQGGRKVAIIYEADRMNNPTANAFLKTLEEPPRDTTLLLLTTRPYALLDTIRSRCFNFRLPALKGNNEDEEWQEWIRRYHDWLNGLIQLRTGAAERAHAVIGLYGLIARFLNILERLGKDLWTREKENLPENLDADELSAHEVGLRKSIRHQLFAEIETATRLFAINASHQIPFPALALTRAVNELENIVGLLEVNLKEEVVLEAFLLKSLRIWVASVERPVAS